MKKQSRRGFLTSSLPITIGTGLGLTSLNATGKQHPDTQDNRLKLLIVGAHPDDPETMCGGTMALYSAAGHEVVSAYLTRGEAGIHGKTYDEAAEIRSSEAMEACSTLKARAQFLGQVDGNCEINQLRYSEILDFLLNESPDILVTHWPIDSHRDHRICSILVYDAWQRLPERPVLYYGEVMSGVQSQNFTPTDYIDISNVLHQKHEACFAHKSQGIENSYEEHHGKMEAFRGMEAGYRYAEAFVRHLKSPGELL